MTTSVGCDWRGRGSPRRSGGARVVAPVAKPIVESGACERVCDSIIRNVMSPEGVASMMLLRNRKPTLLFGRTHGNRRAQCLRTWGFHQRGQLGLPRGCGPHDQLAPCLLCDLRQAKLANIGSWCSLFLVIDHSCQCADREIGYIAKAEYQPENKQSARQKHAALRRLSQNENGTAANSTAVSKVRSANIIALRSLRLCDLPHKSGADLVHFADFGHVWTL